MGSEPKNRGSRRESVIEVTERTQDSVGENRATQSSSRNAAGFLVPSGRLHGSYPENGVLDIEAMDRNKHQNTTADYCFLNENVL
jgi:hypothetical protein